MDGGRAMSIDLPLFAYDLVMADPPWPWQAYSAKGHEKSPEGQYSTMTFAEIEALRIGDLIAPGGVLFLWATWPLVQQQLRCVERWGLQVKTGGVWAKRTESGKFRWGTGYVLRSVCEPFFVATLPDSGFRGSSAPNLIETIERAAIDGLAREHSRKPDEVYSLLETLTPGARRADIFARQRRPGWDGWGNELEKFDEVGA
jgi:N6-adenosine-specific RNA methylase IME4